MATIVKIISTEIDNLGSRIVKFLRFGKSDVQTSVEISPYGVDSNPIKNMAAIYAETSGKGKTIIIGYINTNQLAEVGEVRLFSTDADGTQKFYTWLKNDGTYEIGGNAKNLARFQELETGFNQLRSDFNAFLTHVHGGAGSPPTPPATPSTASIAGAKIDEIKTL